MIKRIATTTVVWIAGATLLICAWSTHLQNRNLRKENTMLLKGREYPYLLTGLEMDVAGQIEQVRATAPGRPKRNERLVLVSSDVCSICEKNAEKWQKLLMDTSRLPEEVWLVTFDTTELFGPLEAALARRGTPYRVMRIRDAKDFSLRTGIVGVPLTMLMDAKNTPTALHSGALTADMLRRFINIVDGRSSLPANRPFLPGGSAELALR